MEIGGWSSGVVEYCGGMRVRCCLVLLMACVCGSARADSIFLDSYGTWAPSGFGALAQTESLLYPPSTTGSFPALASLTASDQAGATFLISGLLVYADGSGDVLTLFAQFTSSTYDANGNLSADGFWSYIAGTGGFDPSRVGGGSGTLAVTLTNAFGSGGSSATVLAGELSPAPEPGSAVAILVGCAGLLGRRRARTRRTRTG
ncbi:MAG TPA: PEP-CTERM sorting domain-containing protein, partial [Fimbriimonadaceae bacterium]|nr:PEP-CTERM sorting domain-containing protein [Fimbriimonadaceae bacterium]